MMSFHFEDTALFHFCALTLTIVVLQNMHSIQL